jgi:hypothetical protein
MPLLFEQKPTKAQGFRIKKDAGRGVLDFHSPTGKGFLPQFGANISF